MVKRLHGKLLAQQLATLVVLGGLAAFGVALAVAAVRDLWLLIIIWANG